MESETMAGVVEHPLLAAAREEGRRQGLIERSEPGGSQWGLARYMWAEWALDPSRPTMEEVEAAFESAFEAAFEA